MQGMGSASQGSARPVTPPSSQPIASLSSSESAAAISLLALAPGTPPGTSSPQGAPMLQPSASCSGEFSAVPLQQQLAGPAVAAQGPAAGQGQAAEPMDSDMLPAGALHAKLLHIKTYILYVYGAYIYIYTEIY